MVVFFVFFLVFPFANLQSQIKTISIFSAPINDRRGRGREGAVDVVLIKRERVHTWDTLGEYFVNFISLFIISF